jgi:hypothetical protein
MPADSNRCCLHPRNMVRCMTEHSLALHRFQATPAALRKVQAVPTMSLTTQRVRQLALNRLCCKVWFCNACLQTLAMATGPAVGATSFLVALWLTSAGYVARLRNQSMPLSRSPSSCATKSRKCMTVIQDSKTTASCAFLVDSSRPLTASGGLPGPDS